VLGDFGYWLMLVTALFATAGATNAGLYPATGLSDHLAATGQWPTVMGRRILERVPVGLVVPAVAISAMLLFFDLSAIASIGSAVALLIFALVSIGHLRVRRETGANLGLLLLAVTTTLISLITFVFTTLIEEPASVVALIGIVIISAGLDVTWARARGRQVATTG
jgi:L-asparagine transporter-like permease